VVVTVGLTIAEPLAYLDLNLPGVMTTLVAPFVDQLSVLLEPEVIVVGLAAKELIFGRASTGTVCVEVTDQLPSRVASDASSTVP